MIVFDQTVSRSTAVIEVFGLRFLAARMPDGDFSFRFGLAPRLSTKNQLYRWADAMLEDSMRNWAKRATRPVLLRAHTEAVRVISAHGRNSLHGLEFSVIEKIAGEALQERAPAWETPLYATSL